MIFLKRIPNSAALFTDRIWMRFFIFFFKQKKQIYIFIRRARIMNLINKKVTHKLFGMGSVVKHNDSVIEIHFASENKMFVFPDAFEKHLKLHDKSDASSLDQIIQQREIERKEDEYKKEEERKLQRKTRTCLKHKNYETR